MSRLLPRSLAGRLIALLLLALVASQAIAFAVFLSERASAVQATHREQVLSRAAAVVRLFADTPPGLHQRIVDSATTPRLRFWLTEESHLEPAAPSWREGRIAGHLTQMLEDNVREVRVRVLERPRTGFGLWPFLGSGEDRRRERDWAESRREERELRRWREHRHGRRRRIALIVSILPEAGAAAGPWLNVATVAPPPPAGWAWPSLVSMALMALATTGIVVVMVRRATGPLQRLAAASDGLGRGEAAEPLPEAGPEEVRRTTRAFNRMSARLQRFVQDRTNMLAAISHDLRTPITTLRLRAELLEDAETRAKMLETLAEMQQMAEASLAFAREDAAAEDTRSVDLAALVASLCDDLADLGQDVACAEAPRVALPCRPVSLKRALRNLIENAVRYGERARVRLEEDGDSVVVTVEDDGPGLPEPLLARVFEPFFRQEDSRSRETGGIGLGLAIARSIIRGHGGEVRLENREAGGLRAVVRLPKGAG